MGYGNQLGQETVLKHAANGFLRRDTQDRIFSLHQVRTQQEGPQLEVRKFAC